METNKEGRHYVRTAWIELVVWGVRFLVIYFIIIMVMAIFINLFNGKMVAVYWFCLLNRRGCKLELNLGAYP